MLPLLCALACTLAAAPQEGQEGARTDVPGARPPLQDLSGRALFEDSAPVRDLLVELRRADQEAGSEPLAVQRCGPGGAIHFPGLQPGFYRVTAQRVGAGLRPVVLEAPAGASGLVLQVPGWRLRVRLGSLDETGAKLPPPTGASLRFRTLTHRSVQAAGASWPDETLFRRMARRTTILRGLEDTGEASFWLDAPAWLEVRALAPGHMPDSRILFLGDAGGGRETALTLWLAPRPDEGRIRLRLQGADAVLPSPPACIVRLLPVLDGPEAAWEEASVEPDRLTPSLPPGRYLLEVLPDDAGGDRPLWWLPWRDVEAVVAPGGESRLDLELRAGGRLAVDVRLDAPAAGTAPPRPWLELLATAGGPAPPAHLGIRVAALPADPEGRPAFRLEPREALPAGSWRVRVRIPGQRPVIREARIATGETTRLEIFAGRS